MRSEPIRYRDEPEQAPDGVVAMLSYLDAPPPLSPTVKAWSAKKLQAHMRRDWQRRWGGTAAAVMLAAAAAVGVMWLTSDGEVAREQQLQPLPDSEMIVDDGPDEDGRNAEPAAQRPRQIGEIVEPSARKPSVQEPSVEEPPAPRQPSPVPVPGPSANPIPKLDTAPKPAAAPSSQASPVAPSGAAPGAALPTIDPHASPQPPQPAAPGSDVVLVDPHARPSQPRSPSPPPRVRQAPKPPPPPRSSPGPVIVNPHASPTPPAVPR